jgi:hypothetical protein
MSSGVSMARGAANATYSAAEGAAPIPVAVVGGLLSGPKRFKYLSSICSLIVIQLASRGYKALSIKLNDSENHRTQTEYDDALIIKNFLFEFINNYFTLFFIAFLMNMDIPFQSLWDWYAESNHLTFPHKDITPCPGSSCVGVLQAQLGTVFTAKQVIQQVKQAVKPFISKRMRLKAENKGIIAHNKTRPPEQQFPLTIENPYELERIKEPYHPRNINHMSYQHFWAD